MSIASTLGLAEVSKNISKVLRIMILLKCINIMIHFGKCIKYQYHDTILNQVSVSVSRYNLKVSSNTADFIERLKASAWHQLYLPSYHLPMPDPSPSTLTVLNSNFLQLGRRSGGRPQPTVYPRWFT